MISEFDVIRMLLDIQEAPEKMPDNMMTKTKDTIIRENIRDLLKQAENVTKPEQNVTKPEQNAKESASAAISSKDLVAPLLREKEAMKKLSGGQNRNSTRGSCRRCAGPGGRSRRLRMR